MTAKNEPKPRIISARLNAVYSASRETWLEPEEYAYTPNGSQIRRCYAYCDDGVKRVVMCGIPDTYFSIPAHCTIKGKYLKGYITTGDQFGKFDGEFLFHSFKAEEG